MKDIQKKGVITDIKLKRICYIITSFPQISETFIVEEAISLYDFKVDFSIFSQKEGDFSLVHPSAQRLLDQKKITYIKKASKIESLIALIKLISIFPLNTLKTLIKAINHPLRWRYFQALPYAQQLLKTKTDYIHAHFADDNLRFAAIISEWNHIPYGFTAHRYDILDDPLSVNEFITLSNNAKAIVTVSETNKQIITEKYKLHPSKIYVAYNGICIEKFKPTPKNQKNSIIQVLNVGRLVPVKGQDILIQAIAIVVEKDFNIKLNIIGEGPYRQYLERQITDLNLSKHIELLGSKSQEVVQEYMSNSDIFIMPSRSEGFAVALLEAMAMELPVIASNGSGFPEAITNYVNGLLVEAEKPDLLANAIIWMIKNPEKRIKMGLQGRKKVQNHFTRHKVTAGLLGFITNSIK